MLSAGILVRSGTSEVCLTFLEDLKCLKLRGLEPFLAFFFSPVIPVLGDPGVEIQKSLGIPRKY